MKKYKWVFLSWLLLVILFSFAVLAYSPMYQTLNFRFKPGLFKSAMISVEINHTIRKTGLSERELSTGRFSVPGAQLVSFEGILNSSETSGVADLTWTPVHLKKKLNTIVLRPIPGSENSLGFSGEKIGFGFTNDVKSFGYYSSIFSSIILVSFIYFLIYLARLRPFPKHALILSLVVVLWMSYHLLVIWPGLIGYDGVLNIYQALSLKTTSFVQPLTTFLNSAFLNFHPHYVWNSVLTIFLMGLAFGLMSYHLGRDKKVFWGLVGLTAFFLLNPLNVYTNLFISRDSVFSWTFFIAVLYPVFIVVSRKQHSIIQHFIFLFFFFLSLQMRKEVTILFPFALLWSYWTLKSPQLWKSTLYGFFILAITLSFFGTKRLEYSITNPFYQAVNLINPVGEILNEKGLGILSEKEKMDLAPFLDLNLFTKNYIRHDLSNESLGALSVHMTEKDLYVFTKLYIRLMLDYPGIWLKNRSSVFLGSLGLNNLWPNYASDIRIEDHLPDEYFYNLHSINLESLNIVYPEWLLSWKQNLWEIRYGSNWIRYAFLSFAIPLILTLCCLPFLKKAPATALALFFNLGRLFSIIPFMPASYFKYMYSGYLIFLFLPIMLWAELKAGREIKKGQ